MNDILDFSKIEAGELDLERTPVNLRELVEASVHLYSGQAKEKGLELGFHLEDRLPAAILADAVRLRQILHNLLSNALKFTSEGTIEVRLGTCGDQLCFEVSDTGIGLPEDRIQHLFAPFAQADASTTRTYGGTGLGLAICQRLVERLGGKIGAANRAEGGSLFQFVLPFESADPVEPPEEEVEINLQPLRVLLAEDNQVNQVVATMLLEKNGHEVVLAPDGEQAVASFCDDPRFDLILMDVSMPFLDGHDATRRIRKFEEEEGLDRTPIIALTAHSSNRDRAQCKDSGMDGFVCKPILEPDLLRAMAEALPHSKRDL